MLSLKLEERYPPNLFAALREDFRQMYVVGWEQGRLEVNQHSAKAIGQYDLNGKLVNSFKSLKEACKRTGFSKNGIMHSMKNEVPTRQKWFWRYL